MHPEIIRKIKLLKVYLDDLREYTVLSMEDILENKDKLRSMERCFQLMTDGAFDVNGALAYQISKKIPEDNKSTFYELSDLGILDKDFANSIAESAKARNELTHNYEKVQKSEMVDNIKRFADMYEKYIKILIDKFIPKE